MKISDKVYDFLKYLAQYVLPALGTLYFALSKIWGLPYAEQIVGTILAVDVFLGALVSVSATYYNKQLKGYVDKKQMMFLENYDYPEKKVKSTWLSDQLSRNVYDFLYWIGLILLPALGTLYFALSGIWGFPYGEDIMGTIVALDAFLGVLLGVGNSEYKEVKNRKENETNAPL